MKSALVATTMSILALTLSGVAHGEDKGAARAAFAEGQRRYDLNEFDAALAAFKQAYLAYEDPAFLYNIAQCHRQLGNKAEAIKFYRSYLRKVPDAPNRSDVQSVVATLEQEVATEKAATPPAPVPAASSPPTTQTTAPAAAVVVASAPEPRRTPVYKKWWLWTVVGVVAAGAAVGTAVALTSGRSEHSFMPVTVTQ